MRGVPRGKLITINEIRVALAKKHGATVGCPITTGIFAWIAAHAGQEEDDPLLKSGGELNAKYPGRVQALEKLIEKEGHRVVPKGKHWQAQQQTRARTKSPARVH